MMDKTAILPDGSCFSFWEVPVVYERELHVDCNHPEADDGNEGTAQKPFKTINKAASVATPGTRIWIHQGVYRECVRPVMGGQDPAHMICYEAFGNGEVVIKASEQVYDFKPSTGWRIQADFNEKPDRKIVIWEHRLSPDMFPGYNPFCAVNILHDRLFIEYDKTDMSTYLNRRGMVFCDGKPLTQVALYNQMSKCEGSYWVEANGQTVHFRLPGDENPADHVIEVTCREQCFAPEIPFLSYIKVKGITCAHAATGAPVPQRGAISCYRGHHWVIENCVIDWTNAVGIDVGNECWHHDILEGQQIGYSVVRGCTIKDAGVCGIAGLFATHMLIEDNLIEGTGWQKMELSWEAGAIKLHNSVNGLFRRNVFRNTFRADHLWLDCGNENNRITGNLFLDGVEQREAIFIECTRDGINLIDHNIIWNVEGRFDPAKVPMEPGSSGWYKMEEPDVVNGYGIYGEGTDHLRIVHNLIGNCRSAGYFAKPVSYRMQGMDRGGTSRDAWFVNNLFYRCREAALKLPTKDNLVEGNCYVREEGGYLRILHPQPPVCLHLPAWKEFYGFDQQGQEAWFDIAVDTVNMTLQFTAAEAKPFAFPGELERRQFVYDPEALRAVAPCNLTDTDFYGVALEKEQCIPGPLAQIEAGKVYRLDPRKGDNR
ncbi:MAG: right-handed parallel beta-helix repeat-containing protein [Clostridiales bacterium]|nr:right-handed parallel beta-helix repeat-containing protein [Clostridiales bacterium]